MLLPSLLTPSNSHRISLRGTETSVDEFATLLRLAKAEDGGRSSAEAIMVATERWKEMRWVRNRHTICTVLHIQDCVRSIRRGLRARMYMNLSAGFHFTHISLLSLSHTHTDPYQPTPLCCQNCCGRKMIAFLLLLRISRPLHHQQ